MPPYIRKIVAMETAPETDFQIHLSEVTD